MIVTATLYEWLLFGHILAAMAWFGGLAMLLILGIRVLRAGELDAIASFLRSLRVVGPLLLAPSVVALLGLGIWMVTDSPAWQFDQTWVQTGIGLPLVTAVIGAAVGGRAALLAERAAHTRDLDETRRQLCRWLWGISLVLVLLVIAVWDMTLKPGL
jgi:uncharacterized membrane protein